MSTPLQTTELHIPLLRPNLVPRLRLISILALALAGVSQPQTPEIRQRIKSGVAVTSLIDGMRSGEEGFLPFYSRIMWKGTWSLRAPVCSYTSSGEVVEYVVALPLQGGRDCRAEWLGNLGGAETRAEKSISFQE